MMNPFFSALCHEARPIGDGTAGALVQWLQDYLRALFPDNGIEYWSCNEWSNHPLDLSPETLVSSIGPPENRFSAAACWATQGTSEGRLIQVYLIRHDRSLYRLAWVKTFDTLERAWQMATAVHMVLEEYLECGQAPAIVSIFRSLPTANGGSPPGQQPDRSFELCASLSEVKIVCASGDACFSKHIEGAAPEFMAQAYLSDCRKVLSNLGLKFTEALSPELNSKLNG